MSRVLCAFWVSTALLLGLVLGCPALLGAPTAPASPLQASIAQDNTWVQRPCFQDQGNSKQHKHILILRSNIRADVLYTSSRSLFLWKLLLLNQAVENVHFYLFYKWGVLLHCFSQLNSSYRSEFLTCTSFNMEDHLAKSFFPSS